MTVPAPTRPVTVSGGPYGLEVRHDDLIRLAALARAAAGTARDVLGDLSRLQAIPDDANDAGGAADFREASRLAMNGLTVLAEQCTGIEHGLRHAAAAYTKADAPQPFKDQVMGISLLSSILVPISWPFTAHESFLTGHPQIIDAAENLLSMGHVSAVSGLLATGLFLDGLPVVRAAGIDVGVDCAGPPRSFHDLMAGLSARNEGSDGEIDVRILSRRDGSRRVIVDVPGTKDWSLARRNPAVANLGTDLAALAGRKTTYEKGVTAALTAAGVRPIDEVMLVGHSEGGVIAAAIARDVGQSADFHITHVIAAGAPISSVRLPGSVNVLAIENAGDIVPRLDGRPNASNRANLTTVTLHRDHGDVTANHTLRSTYLPGAVDIDASDDASVRAYRASVQGFLDADAVTTGVYLISRRYR